MSRTSGGESQAVSYGFTHKSDLQRQGRATSTQKSLRVAVKPCRGFQAQVAASCSKSRVRVFTHKSLRVAANTVPCECHAHVLRSAATGGMRVFTHKSLQVAAKRGREVATSRKPCRVSFTHNRCELQQKPCSESSTHKSQRKAAKAVAWNFYAQVAAKRGRESGGESQAVS